MPKEPKTKKTNQTVSQYINSLSPNNNIESAKKIDQLLEKITNQKASIWGSSIIGYGIYNSPSGEWPRIGFSPRKTNLVIYIMSGFEDLKDLLKKLGPHKLGKSCLYIKKLEDIDESILTKIMSYSWKAMLKRYPADT